MIPKIGSVINRFDELESTNSFASRLLQKERPQEGCVVLAHRQAKGKGQGSNKWESEPDANLTFSIILYPAFIDIARQFEISKVISLGITDFLNNYVDNVSIKWPNDIYVGGKKICGILMEYSIQRNKISSCVIGIGLNINQTTFLSDAPNPVSLCLLTDKKYDLDRCLHELLKHIDHRYHQLISKGTTGIDKDYEDLLYKKEIWSQYSAREKIFEGKITGVDEHGLLIIHTRQQEILKFDYKEISFLI